MTLKELMAVLPGYTTVHVHDKTGTFAHKGNPHDFTIGLFNKYAAHTVSIAVPLSSYTMEITLEDKV
jgi:hypothetical protein